MKKYSLLAAAMIFSSAAVFAEETTTQDVNVIINAQENIHLTTNLVTLIPLYNPTSGVNTSGGPAPTLEDLDVVGGQLITYGTSAVRVTASFATGTGAGTDVTWASGDKLTVTALGQNTVALYGASGEEETTNLIPTGVEGTGTYSLRYSFTSINVNKGNGTMTGVVTFTATAAP
jgi:hypothetical protein